MASKTHIIAWFIITSVRFDSRKHNRKLNRTDRFSKYVVQKNPIKFSLDRFAFCLDRFAFFFWIDLDLNTRSTYIWLYAISSWFCIFNLRDPNVPPKEEKKKEPGWIAKDWLTKHLASSIYKWHLQKKKFQHIKENGKGNLIP